MEAFPNALTEVNKMLQTNPSIIAYSTAVLPSSAESKRRKRGFFESHNDFGSKFVIKACCVMTSGGVNGT
jgi:hypothetical protein